MAINEGVREVSMPLEPDVRPTGDVDDSDDGGSDDSGDGDSGDSAPAAARSDGQQGRSGKPTIPGRTRGRDLRQQIFKQNQDLTRQLGELTGRLSSQERQFQQQITQIQQRFAQPQTPAQQAGTPAPTEDERQLDTLQAAMAAEMEAYASRDPKAKYDLTRYNKLSRQARALENKIDLVANLRSFGIDPTKKPEPQQRIDPNQMARQVAQNTIRDAVVGEFTWLADPNLPQNVRDAMGTTLGYLISVKRRPDNLDTHREAAAMVAAEYRIPSPRRQAPPSTRFSPVEEGSRGGQQTYAEIPTAQLEGTGLSPDALRRAISRATTRK